MFLFLLFVASQITGALACSCGRELFQETYCRNNYVIRARKIRDGTIRGQPKPLVNQFSLVFEVKVNHVYKQPYGSNITKHDMMYMVTSDISKSATCGMVLNEGRDYMFVFQNYGPVVNSCTSRMWRQISGFQQKLLATHKYDCSCTAEECLDRTTNVKGKDRECITSESHVNLLFCAKSSDDRKRCVWKGPKKSCVNPAGQYGRGNYLEYGKHNKKRKIRH